MRRVEVRCCCSPMKLLGTLPFPDAAQSFDYTVMQPATSDYAKVAAHGVRCQKITLHLVDWCAPNGKFHMVPMGKALKADGVAIETLRRIPGFIEATPVAEAPVKVGPPLPSFQHKESS